MIVACRTGVPAREWLEDSRALITAAHVLEEADRKARRK